MSTSDGSVVGVTKIVDHGPDASRWNVVILGDGYQSQELATYATDAEAFANTLSTTEPFQTLWAAVNVHRVDVSSTDSGADDPVACGGTGATANTYFDATFCGDGSIQRLLTVNTATATSVASAQVPAVSMTFVIVNSATYGGSGGAVAVFSTAAGADEIGLHEMGHTAFGFADEYSYYAGCDSGETGHNSYTGAEPAEPNVTTVTNRATIKWASLVAAATNLPTTSNGDCSKCDPQASPVAAGTVGAFEGARYFHCGIFRPEFNCRMRTLGDTFCAVCAGVITAKLTPYLPPAPAITAFTPQSGDTAGGTIVVITGSGFTGATEVDFGLNPAVVFNVDSDTQITAMSPAGSGAVNLSVTALGGASAQTLAAPYTYTAAVSTPAVTAIAPVTGPDDGGTAVIITGARLTGAGTVMFGATAANSFTIDSDVQISAMSPASGVGTVDVTVTTAAGTSSASAADQFTFTLPAPIVSSLSPAAGPAAGGTSVVITGTGFTGASAVTFGTAPATFSVDSDTQITAQSPPGTATADVTVTTAVGTSATVAADVFTYQSTGTGAPVVTAISPTSGSAAGGDTVTLTGTGFTGATTVGFGTTGATQLTVDSDTQITTVSPAGTGTVDVTVTTPAGTSATGPADEFGYTSLGLPSVQNVNPNTGSPDGGDSVTISGIGFTNASEVLFGTADATFNVDSDTEISASTPAGTGSVDVTVVTPAGTSATGGADTFTYV